MKLTAIILLWLGVSALNFGALNAQAKIDFGCTDNRRRDAVMCAFIAAFPIGVLATIAITGFYEHGFSFKIGCDK